MTVTPTRNPFPQDAVVTDSIHGLPVFRTQSFTHAEEKLNEFVLDFWRDGNPAYLVFGIRGRYGSGKTHLALQIMDRITEQEHAAPQMTSKCIYAKAARADLFELYRNDIAGKLKESDLKALVAAHLQKILRESNQARPRPDSGETAPATFGEIAQVAIADRASDDPEYILELQSNNLLPSDLRLQFDEELRGTDPKLREDFVKAYSKIIHPSLGAKACAWIQGQPLSAIDAEDLGVTLPHLEPRYGRDALKFLLTAYRRAGMAFVFCLDEFERLMTITLPASLPTQPSVATTPPAAPAPATVDVAPIRAFLKDLSEIFRDAGQVLIISGVEQTWDALSADVYARISRDNILDTQLRDEEPRELLQAYSGSARTSVAMVFSNDALPLLLEVTDYNARRLLQLAHYAFEAAAGQRITGAHVRTASVKALGDRQRTETVVRIIQSTASEFGLDANADVEVSGVRCDFALGDPVKPTVLIFITRSIFRIQEVREARTIVDNVPDVARANPQARTCAVIVGYTSIPVRNELSKAVDRILVYDEDQFLKEFRDFLAWSVRAQPVVKPIERASTEQLDRLEREVLEEDDALKRGLEEIESDRQRRVETSRKASVSDRIRHAFSKLSSHVRAEEMLYLDVQANSRVKRIDKTTFERAIELIDWQRRHVRNAAYIKQGFAESDRFATLLDAFSRALDTGESVWKDLYTAERRAGETSSSKVLSGSFAERRDILRDLENLEVQRADQDRYGALSFAAPLLRQPPAFRVLAVLSVAGLLVGTLVLWNGWTAEVNGRRNLQAALSSLQSSIADAQTNLFPYQWKDRIASDPDRTFQYNQAVEKASSGLYEAGLKYEQQVVDAGADAIPLHVVPELLADELDESIASVNRSVDPFDPAAAIESLKGVAESSKVMKAELTPSGSAYLSSKLRSPTHWLPFVPLIFLVLVQLTGPIWKRFRLRNLPRDVPADGR